MKSTFAYSSKLLLVLLIASSLISSCASPTPTATPVPTIGQETLVALAVRTISAQMTEEAFRNPTSTPTNTPVPPTATAVPPTETPAPTLPPTETPTQVVALSAKFLYATALAGNGREYVPNTKFGLEMGFENTGTITWEPGYRLKLVSFKGEVTVQPEIELNVSVAPGQKAVFDLWAFGSETLGDHQWVFQLYSSQGVPVPGGVGYFSYKAI